MITDTPSVMGASDVDFSYGKLKVLNGLLLQVPAGEIFGVLGANGAGKTTLMRLLIGLLKPEVGEIRLFGDRPSSRLASRIGYMSQLNALYLELTVEHNVDFFARMYGIANSAPRREAVDAALELVALKDRRKDPILRLSGGMRQRASLAIALWCTIPSCWSSTSLPWVSTRSSE